MEGGVWIFAVSYSMQPTGMNSKGGRSPPRPSVIQRKNPSGAVCTVMTDSGSVREQGSRLTCRPKCCKQILIVVLLETALLLSTPLFWASDVWVSCAFCFETFISEGRGEEKGGDANFKNKSPETATAEAQNNGVHYKFNLMFWCSN